MASHCYRLTILNATTITTNHGAIINTYKTPFEEFYFEKINFMFDPLKVKHE